MAEPLGQRFSLIYLRDGQPATDSPRLRKRLARQLEELCGDWQSQSRFGRHFVTETGAQVSHNAGTYYTNSIFDQGELRDVLDAITVFYGWLKQQHDEEREKYRAIRYGISPRAKHTEWSQFVARALREENVGYRLDEACGVHYFVDEDFERGRLATLVGLGSPLLANARQAYEDAFRHLDSTPRDTKAAVRSVFEAAEILAKQIVPVAQRLNGKIIEGELRTKCIAALGGDATEQKALASVFDSFGEWVTAMHLYRHGQAGDEPVAPSEELAVHAISTGSAYIRLLATTVLRNGGQ